MMMEDNVKTKQSIFEPIRKWWWQRQMKRAVYALEVLIEHKDPSIYKQIHDIAEVMARQMCMKWLDNQGLRHCSRCPNTKSLITVEGVVLCVGHARKASENGKVNIPLAVIKA